MKLNIKLFSGGANTINMGAIREVSAELKSIAESFQSTYNSIVTAASKVDNLGAWQSSHGVNGLEIEGTLQNLQTEIETFIGALTSLSGQLDNVAGTYEGIDNKVKVELEDWAAQLKNVVNKIVGGINSTTPKGSYSAVDYASHMSQSAKVIVNEVATMVQNTGNMYASVTGTNLAGTVKTLFDWVGSSDVGSRMTTFVGSLFGV